jgi:hypothetical protein
VAANSAVWFAACRESRLVARRSWRFAARAGSQDALMLLWPAGSMGCGMRRAWLPAMAAHSESGFAGQAMDPVCRRARPPFASQETARLGDKALAHAPCNGPSTLTHGHQPSSTASNDLQRGATLFNLQRGAPRAASILGLRRGGSAGHGRTARRGSCGRACACLAIPSRQKEMGQARRCRAQCLFAQMARE